MDRERSEGGREPRVPPEIGSEWAEFIQQQIQIVFQSALPHMVQQISERAMALPSQPSSFVAIQPTGQDPQRSEKFTGVGERELKVAEPEKFSGKRNGEVYRWFAQLRLVFRGKPHTYQHDEDKVAYALSYLTGAAQSWAMPLLQALYEGRGHVLLANYDAFRESVIAIYGDIDRRGNAEDHLAKIKQTGSVAAYVSSFNEHAAQVEWNEPSLVARFRAGLKDEILDSIATTETHPRVLQEWIAMASRIDERLWARRQIRRSQNPSTNPSQSLHVTSRASPHATRDHADRFQVSSEASGPTPMELGAAKVTTALAKTAAERLEYQRQGKC